MTAPDCRDDYADGLAQERHEDAEHAQREADEAAEWAERDLADMDKLTTAAMAGRVSRDLARIAALNVRLGWVA